MFVDILLLFSSVHVHSILSPALQRFKEAHGSKVLQEAIKSTWRHNITITNFILKHCEQRQWHEDIVYQLFICLQTDDVYRLVMDVIGQRRLFGNGRAEIFAIVPPLEYKVRLTFLQAF